MKFNSDFWIVAATVAPVIALAAIVSFNEGVQRVKTADLAKPFRKSTSVAMKVQATVLLLACFNGGLQTIILSLSLASIADEYNAASPAFITGALGVGMLLTFSPSIVYLIPVLLSDGKLQAETEEK